MRLAGFFLAKLSLASRIVGEKRYIPLAHCLSLGEIWAPQ
jgi:hypothetical protein